MYRRYLQCWLVFFLFLFLIHICLSMSSLECKASCIVMSFLFSDPFIEVLPSSTARMVPSILRGGQPRRLYLWWDFCYIVSFESCSRSPEKLIFNLFFFHLPLFDGDRFQYSQIFISSLFSDCSDSFFFLPFAVLRCSLLAWNIFRWHITSLYPDCIYIFTKPFARTEYDTRSIFKRSLTGLNSEFSFS